ncbi:SH3 domain-containing protein [Streptomyces thermolilacinus]|uniref:SH3 domain-containing protein n=1 Tax=Streptomyces thermolilacinus TaxID=285540 RepID=UPI0033E1968D
MGMRHKAATGAVALGMLGLAVAPATAAPLAGVDSAATARAASCYVYNVSGGAVNIRSGPGQRYTLIGTLAKGAKLPCGTDRDSQTTGQRYTSCGGGDSWSTIRVNGRDGWVASECVAFGA